MQKNWIQILFIAVYEFKIFIQHLVLLCLNLN